MSPLQEVETFVEHCRQAGLSVTQQRIAIYQLLAQRGGHLTAQELHDRLRKQHPTLSLNTVYTNLEALVSVRLVNRVTINGERSHYYDANEVPHVHLVCQSCGAIEDLPKEDLDTLVLPRSATRHFRVTGYRLQIDGVCHRCKQ